MLPGSELLVSQSLSMVLLWGGIVSTELELELQLIKSNRRLCSISLIFCSLSVILSLISRSMVASDDIPLQVSSSTAFVLSREEGMS